MISMTEAMEDNAKLLESLFVKAADYGKTSFELAKLKALDKTSDVVSSIIPVWAMFILIGSFLLFFNVGLAFWLGEILGRLFFGFFVVAAFYLISWSVLYLFLRNWLKMLVRNYLVKQLLN